MYPQTELSAPTLVQPSPDMNREQLKNKLEELQAKKSRMDDMLQELQTLRADPFLLLNNGNSLEMVLQLSTQNG